MPSLNWIGKEAVVNHDKEVPFRLLKKVKGVSVGEDSQNLIIHGDNLEGLKALMPYYYGKVKCIYIDPPYNTGNESWVYNDKVNSPKIKQWLGRAVGKESEDLTRHDKWLCMMYPRFMLLRDLLAKDGVIFVSIDDSEYHSLRFVLDEIFSADNFVQNFLWLHGKGKKDKWSRTTQQYVLSYAKDKSCLVPWSIFVNKNYQYSNPDNDRRGPWFSGSMSFSEDRSNKKHQNYFSIESPTGVEWTRQWQISKVEMMDLLENNKIYWGPAPNFANVPRVKIFPTDVDEQIPPNLLESFGTTKSAENELKELFGDKVFDYPKPKDLVKHLISLVATDKYDIVLDSFAGSGTTGHAVLDLNKGDDGNRKFILIEMEDKIARDITAERVKRAINKYDYKDGFEYCELDKPLFNEHGQIEESCDFNQFATYIYFTETQKNIDKKEIDGNFIGKDDTTEYYLVYKEPKQNMLDKSLIKKLRNTENRKVVYADRCMLDDDTLKELDIVFKQIPYDVKIY